MSNSFIIILMNELHQLIEDFKLHSDSHPNISTIWTLFLSYKLHKFNKILLQAKNVLNNLQDNNDLTIEQIYLLSNI